MEPTTLCLLWKKVVEIPGDAEVIALTKEQQTELGQHANACEYCHECMESRMNDPVCPAGQEDSFSFEDLPLWCRMLLEATSGDNEKRTPEEDAFLVSSQKAYEKSRREITEAVQALLTAYPKLAPASFGIPGDVPLLALWQAQHFLMLMAERSAEYKMNGTELESVLLREDGSMLVNGANEIPSETIQGEVYDVCREDWPKFDKAPAEKVVRWLYAAVRIHPPLLDPIHAAYDPAGQRDYLAAWRITS